MGIEILICVDEYEKRVAILKDKVLDGYYIERNTEQTIVGNVYKGRVESIVRGIEAAFVDIGLKKNGFLYVSDIIGHNEELEQNWMADEFLTTDTFFSAERKIDDLIKKKQEIVVQVVKEPFGTKGPRLTTQISMPGRLLVFMPYAKQAGISKRIEDTAERKRLREILKEIHIPGEGGIIVRTLGVGANKKDLARELKYMIAIWQKIKYKQQRQHAPSLLYTEEDIVSRITRDNLSNETERLVVNSKFEYQKVLRLVRMFMPALRSKIQLYSSEVDLFQRYDINKQIERIYDRRVNLKKGGYIILEKTEGLMTVDVNSGTFTKSKDLEETAYLVNMEAAREISRQIRLRDIGGIIVIDFIDMGSSQNRKSILATLEKELENDKAKINILSLSGLGLVEMSRQRIRRGPESIAYQSCPYCDGKGTVKSEQTISIEVMRKIATYLKTSNKNNIWVYVNPAVSLKLLNEHKSELIKLEKKFHTHITIASNSAQHLEVIKITPRTAQEIVE
ncbi:MAG: Rne/Rng family ribonuclease [Candidatus Omnitrophota bacterium]